METIYEAISPEEAKKHLECSFMEIEYLTTIDSIDKKLPRVIVGFSKHQWDKLNQATNEEMDDYYLKLLPSNNYIADSELTYLDVYDYLKTPSTRSKKDLERLEAVINTHNSDALNRDNESKVKKAIMKFAEENPGNILFIRIIIDYRG